MYLQVETHKSIQNEVFCHYLKKLHEINSFDKVSIHQWLQGAAFALYAFNSGLVHGTDTTIP